MAAGEYHWHPTIWRVGDECWHVATRQTEAGIRYEAERYGRVLSVGPVGIRLRLRDGRIERVRYEHTTRLWRTRAEAERYAAEHIGPVGTGGMMGTPGNGAAATK